jgi:hypothetical protein
MPPVTTAEQHISNNDPKAYVGDPLHPGQESGLDKGQTALDGEVTGLIRGLGEEREDL